MSRAMKSFAFFALALLAIGCQKTPAPPAVATTQAEVADSKSAFNIMAAGGLADITDGNVKYIGSLTLGEKVGLTGKTTKAGTGANEREWVEVKRDSGKTGWARTDFVVSSSLLAVVTADDAVIYSEPKNTGASTKSIPKQTIMAIHSDSAGQAFIKVTFVDPVSKILSKDVYVKNDGVSTKGDDVQSAILLQLAAASDNPTQKQAFLQSASKDYPGSVFIVQIEDALAALTAPAPVKATEKFFATMVSTSDAVNVRDAPDEATGKVLATLSKGQKVDVEEKTSDSYAVKDQNAPWYKVKNPAGWVFGAFLQAEE